MRYSKRREFRSRRFRSKLIPEFSKTKELQILFSLATIEFQFFLLPFFPHSFDLSPSIHPLIQYKLPDATELSFPPRDVKYDRLRVVYTRARVNAFIIGQNAHRFERLSYRFRRATLHFSLLPSLGRILCAEKNRREGKKRQFFQFFFIVETRQGWKRCFFLIERLKIFLMFRTCCINLSLARRFETFHRRGKRRV